MSKFKKYIKRWIYKKIPSTSVLMFHHIDDGNLIIKSGCKLDIKSFLEIIDSGIAFISLDEYFKFDFLKKNPCTITFDDGLKDIYRVAYPELKKRGIPFTIFVVTNFLNKEGYITTEELLEMSKDPLVTIGAHGVTHDILKGMSFEKQKYEMINSKKNLEKLIKKSVKYFAYSHGQFDDITLDILNKEQIYDFAFVAGGGVTNIFTKKRKFLLPRINCDNSDKLYDIENTRYGKCLIPRI